jgi:competence protein ComEA
MDRFGEWRPIEAAADDEGEKPSPSDVPAKAVEPARPEANAVNVRLLGLLGAGVLAVVGVALWVTSAGARPSLELSGGAAYFDVQSSTAPQNTDASQPTTGGELVVDVEGAVARPGIHRLPDGSRVGDAIEAAGGYAPQVDIAAAAASLNLAQALTDGAKIHVPARGEAAVMTALPRDPSAISPNGSGGLINVNTATSDELDTLPGIGPVTAAKIIAAREQTPFAAIDELVSREVVGDSTFEKLRALVTVGP